jgi:hypothetical protein
MGERERYVLASTAAETMYYLWELQYQQEGRDLDAMMRRLRDLSAYSLTHAEIMWQREIVELLALGMFFGMSSNSALRKNQERLRLLSDETYNYKGQAKIVEQQIAQHKDNRKHEQNDEDEPLQPRLL